MFEHPFKKHINEFHDHHDAKNHEHGTSAEDHFVHVRIVFILKRPKALDRGKACFAKLVEDGTEAVDAWHALFEGDVHLLVVRQSIVKGNISLGLKRHIGTTCDCWTQ